MNNKKVLIIAYYWPPSGGSGVQRWLKFVKYLPEFGWKPYVFTPANPSFAIRDESLLKDIPAEAEVIRFPIWEPYDIFLKLSGATGSKKTAKPTELVSKHHQSWFQKISTWIRGNFFVPDPRIFWVRPSVTYLNNFLKENDIGCFITTGPPHSLHLIGVKLKKKNPSLKWLADFRDPWSEWGLLDSLKVNNRVKKLHQKLERSVLSTADIVTTITPFYQRRFEILGNRKVNLLTNGYDEGDFKGLVYQKPEKFIIRHVGIINEKCDPRPFMTAIDSLMKENQAFGKHVQIEFIGEVHAHFKTYVASQGALNRITLFTPNIPHSQLITMYGSSAVLLLVLNGYKDAEGYMPGKLFEYLATGLPVLGVGPAHGDASNLLNESKAGNMFDAADQENIKAFLLHAFRRWTSEDGNKGERHDNSRYSRKQLTESLTRLLDS